MPIYLNSATSEGSHSKVRRNSQILRAAWTHVSIIEPIAVPEKL